MRIKYIAHEIVTEVRNLPYNIKNVFGWSRVLWNNFDWDHNYMLVILEYKLKKMKKYFETANWLEKAENDKTANEISVSLDACSKLLDEEYKNEIYGKFYEKYPISTFEEWIDEQGRTVHGMKSMVGEERREFTKAYKLADKTDKELRHQLFDNMRDNFEGWWD
jgi:hypothetical protein